MIKPVHIPTLLELLAQGAKDKPVYITTTELARKLGKSQQLASKHLDEMEREGLIERIRSNGKIYVRLTKKGVGASASLYSTLGRVFAEQEKSSVRGIVFSGLGEGAYYVSLKGYRKQFESKLGFDPYPGTLNLKLESAVDRKIRGDLSTRGGIKIEGFSDGKRTYGGAKCLRADINREEKGAVLIIERTSHDDSVIEIISPTNLRRKLNLKDGSSVEITIYSEEAPSEQTKTL